MTREEILEYVKRVDPLKDGIILDRSLLVFGEEKKEKNKKLIFRGKKGET